MAAQLTWGQQRVVRRGPDFNAERPAWRHAEDLVTNSISLLGRRQETQEGSDNKFTTFFSWSVMMWV